MLLLRSLAFVVLFYVWSVFWVLLISPLVLGPRIWMVRSWRIWALGIMALLRVVCDIRVEVRGREHIPEGRALIAPKHQCMLDVFAQFAWLPDSCFVTKKELMWIPFFGWYAYKARMIVVDRAAQATALRKMVVDAKDRFAHERQLVIFRKAPAASRASPATTSPASRPSTANSTSRCIPWPPTPACTGPPTASCGIPGPSSTSTWSPSPQA